MGLARISSLLLVLCQTIPRLPAVTFTDPQATPQDF
jgi:hypothetical protein